jgi:hypothetical protein
VGRGDVFKTKTTDHYLLSILMKHYPRRPRSINFCGKRLQAPTAAYIGSFLKGNACMKVFK